MDCTVIKYMPVQQYWYYTLQGQTKIKHDCFLHDRPWISPWIKSIFNELDITCHVFASQLSGHCDVIANRLWRYRQDVKGATEIRRWCVKILVLASFMDSLCRVWNKVMYVLLWRTVYALTRGCYFGVYFPRCCANWEINTKITLSWAHKQFSTRVHTSSSMYLVSPLMPKELISLVSYIYCGFSSR